MGRPTLTNGAVVNDTRNPNQYDTDPLVPFLHAEWSLSCIGQSRLLDIHAGGHFIWFGKDSADIDNQRIAFTTIHLQHDFQIPNRCMRI